MSFWRSAPGAISVSSTPSSVSLKTQRSVMKITSRLFILAVFPLKVTCSTSLTNFFTPPSFTMASFPPPTENSVPPAVKVPTNTIFLEFWLMSMNPPHPASRGPHVVSRPVGLATEAGPQDLFAHVNLVKGERSHLGVGLVADRYVPVREVIDLARYLLGTDDYHQVFGFDGWQSLR